MLSIKTPQTCRTRVASKPAPPLQAGVLLFLPSPWGVGSCKLPQPTEPYPRPRTAQAPTPLATAGSAYLLGL